jgi:RecG-like helicase
MRTGRQVGVDVVEATLMVVEHAERFGLAALHQLRGRVGRGGRKSHCYLMTPVRRALQRLRIMERSQDGFLIAQADLEHRCAAELLVCRSALGSAFLSNRFAHRVARTLTKPILHRLHRCDGPERLFLGTTG